MMTAPLVFTLVLYSVGMALGQLLFKLAAVHSAKERVGASVTDHLSWYLLSGVVLYGMLTILWVWILRSVPLSKAYPFVALSFIFTPMLSKLFLNELMSPGYYAGLILIAAGIVVIVRT